MTAITALRRARLAPTLRVPLKAAVALLRQRVQFEAARQRGPVALSAEVMQHPIAPELLVGALDRSQAAIAELLAARTPADRAELADQHVKLADAVVHAEAALIGSLDGLDARADRSAPSPYFALRERAFQTLRDAGRVFAKLDPSWTKLVHGGEAWPSLPVVLEKDRGDGEPLRAYGNSFKKTGLTLEQREVEYEERVDKYVSRGGKFDDIVVGKTGVFEGLEPMFRYDYVLEQGGPLRMFPNNDDDDSVGPPKPGHSLLAVGGPQFRDVLATMAGELWVLKDSRGDLEAVVVANNSGHFKPSFEDLSNMIPALVELGVPEEKIVLLAGPNNVPAMFRELEEKYPDELQGLSERLPPVASEVLSAMRAGPEKPLWR